jgi:hypothetical protein
VWTLITDAYLRYAEVSKETYLYSKRGLLTFVYLIHFIDHPGPFSPGVSLAHASAAASSSRGHGYSFACTPYCY